MFLYAYLKWKRNNLFVFSVHKNNTKNIKEKFIRPELYKSLLPNIPFPMK